MKLIKLLLGLFLAVGFLIFCKPVFADTSYDLLAEDMLISPPTPEVNQACTITAKVKNIGAAFMMNFPVNYTFTGTSFVLDSPASYSPAPDINLKTGDYITFSFIGHFTGLRENNLNFSFNFIGFLEEISAENNSLAKTAYVTGNDLITEEIKITPPNPIVGQVTKIDIRVKNNGTRNLFSSTGLFAAYSFPDFAVTKSFSTTPDITNFIKPGDYLYYNYEGKFSAAGEKSLSFTVDPDDQLKQSDLKNNIITGKLEVFSASDVDISADAITLSTNKIIMGEAVDITINIKNSGKNSLIDAAGFSKAAIGISFPNFDYDANTGVTADAYPTVELPFQPNGVFHYKYGGVFNKPGDYTLNFLINKNSELSEANKNNNSTSTAVTVYKDLSAADEVNIVSKTVQLISSTSIKIIWNTNKNSTGIIYYGEGSAQANVYNNQENISDNVSSHSLTLTNLKSNTSYNYILKVINGSAEKIDSLSSFTTPANDDIKITSGPSVKINSAGKSALISWATNLASTGYISYKKAGTGEYTKLGSDILIDYHQAELVNLELGSYEYYIDGKNNQSKEYKSGDLTFSLTASQEPAVILSNPVTSTAVSQTKTETIAIKNTSLYNKLKGGIIIKVQSKGEAYYVDPKTKILRYLGRPEDAYTVIRNQGQGITNANLSKIPLGINGLSGTDSDGDGLPDSFEQAIGTNKDLADTDGDGFSDKAELAKDYSPLSKSNKMNYNYSFASGQKGRIFLQVESRGEAWYVNPADGRRYFLSRPADAFNIMRKLGLGISNNDFQTLSK